MKFQRNPSHARLLELVMAASRVAIDAFSCRATGVDADERILIESVRDEVAIVIGAVRHSATGAEDLTDATVLTKRRRGSADCCGGSTRGDSTCMPNSVATSTAAPSGREPAMREIMA